MFVCVYVYTGLSSFSSFCIFFTFSHFGVFLSFWASSSCLLGCSCVPSPLANTYDPVWVLLLPLCFFHFCLCCWWSLLLLFLFLAGEWQFSVWLVLCLASTRLGKTVTPTAGREYPPVKAPLKPLGLGCLLKPFIFPDSPGLGLVRQDTPPCVEGRFFFWRWHLLGSGG